METVYAIIKALQNATGDLAKQAILDANAGNVDLKRFLKAAYDPAISYYQKKVPKGPYPWNLDNMDFPDGVWSFDYVYKSLTELAARKVSGKQAIRRLHGMMCALSLEGKEMLTLIINRKIGADVGDTMVLKAFPGLYFIPPYQRCSLLDAKAKVRFAKLDRFHVQTKADGSFAYLVHRMDGTKDVITRQGNAYPQAFAEMLTAGQQIGTVIIGELEVTEAVPDNAANRVLLDRKTGNGILTSALKDGEGLTGSQQVRVKAWDMLTEAEFVAGKSERTYDDRLSMLRQEVNMIDFTAKEASAVYVIDSWEVDSLEAAYSIYTDHTSRGLEGVIAKDPASLWKDGTAKDIIKLKLKFEAEYRVKKLIEGEGEMVGMLGAIGIATEDDRLECNCGTGFSKKQRIDFWNNPSLILDEVVMLSANDIIQSRDARKKPALSLPVFEEVRYDKKSAGANTLPEVIDIVAAAKEGK